MRTTPAADEAVAEIEILGFRLRLIAQPGLLQRLRVLFSMPTGSVDSGIAGYSTTLHVHRDEQDHNLYRVECDGAELGIVPHDRVVPYLEWVIHSVAIARLSRRYLLLHAGAVAYRGSGILLCGGSGSGKSTLTAGLVASGFRYLSDEIAPIVPNNLMMHPYPRNICVKAGSRSALGPHFHQLEIDGPRRRFGGEAVWYLQPPLGAWCAEPVPVRYVIFPRYVEGATTELAEISRSSAVEHVVKQSFTGDALGEQSIGAAVRLLQGAECFTLTVGSLPEAVATLSHLVRD